jgi:hypothetical protein
MTDIDLTTLLLDLDLDDSRDPQNHQHWIHRDGTPITPQEASLIASSTLPDATAAMNAALSRASEGRRR